MDKRIALLLLLMPTAAYAGQGAFSASLAAPVASGNSYFGLKSEEDLFEKVRERVSEYWTPSLGHFSAGVQYASWKGQENPAGDRMDFTLNYDLRKMTLFVQGGRTQDFNLDGMIHDRASFGARYDIAEGTSFEMALAGDRYDLVSGSVKNLMAGSWHLSLEQEVGASGRISMSFTRMNSWIPGVVGSNNQISVGYGRALSSSTEVFALYSISSNALPQNPFLLGGGPNSFGLGLKHSF
ncbi:MAG: porin [Burkholderiales bacterium]|nr:porin [Burkholderiales bacterium]